MIAVALAALLFNVHEYFAPDEDLAKLAADLAEEQSKGDRKSFNAQLYKIIKFFDGKDASELQAEFKELDADGSGELDVDEVTALVQKVFGGDVSAEVVQACFEQMDEDKSGEIDFDEFCSFFGVKNE